MEAVDTETICYIQADNERKQLQTMRWAVVAVSFYILVFIGYTWPLSLHFTDSIVGVPNGDSYGYLWNAWVFEQDGGIFSLESDKYFAPLGISAFLHTSTPIMNIFNLLLNNDILGTNLFLALNFILSGLGAYLLAANYIRNRTLCILAGFIFAFSPYKMIRLTGHYNLILTAAVPFFILFFIKAVDLNLPGFFSFRIKSRKFLILCLLMGIIGLLSDYIITLTLLFFVLIYFLTYKIRLKKIKIDLRSFLVLLGIVVVGHFVMRGLKLTVDDGGGIWWGTDLLGLITPVNTYFTQPLVPDALSEKVLTRGIESVTFLGFTMILLTIVSLFVRSSERENSFEVKVLGITALILILMTMPELKFAGQRLFFNILSFFHFIPFINHFRCPGRLIMLVYLLLPLFLLFKLEGLHNQKIFLTFLLLFVIDYLPARPGLLDLSNPPQVYQEINKLPGKTLLSVPFGIKDGLSQDGIFLTEDSYYQTLHGKNLIGGAISRVDPQIRNFYLNDPVMNYMLKLQTSGNIARPEFSDSEIMQFLSVFKPDIILITEKWRKSALEDFIFNSFKPHISAYKEQGNHLILLIGK